MNKTLEMPMLYKRLSKVGLQPKFIQEKALPEWWDAELENNPVAVLEAAGRIAKRCKCGSIATHVPKRKLSNSFCSGAISFASTITR